MTLTSVPRVSAGCRYYLRIVSTTYSSSPSHSVQTYQYTSHANDVVIPRSLPAIYFRYDFSPVSIRMSRTHQPFAHFLTELCAIIGGVAVILRLIHSMAKGMQRKRDDRGAGGEEVRGGAGPTRYEGLSVNTPAEASNGFVGGRTGPMSPEVRAVLSPHTGSPHSGSPFLGSPHGGSPHMRQVSAPTQEWGMVHRQSQWSNGAANEEVVSHDFDNVAHGQVHRQQVQVQGTGAKTHRGHDD